MAHITACRPGEVYPAKRRPRISAFRRRSSTNSEKMAGLAPLVLSMAEKSGTFMLLTKPSMRFPTKGRM